MTIVMNDLATSAHIATSAAAAAVAVVEVIINCPSFLQKKTTLKIDYPSFLMKKMTTKANPQKTKMVVHSLVVYTAVATDYLVVIKNAITRQ